MRKGTGNKGFLRFLSHLHGKNQVGQISVRKPNQEDKPIN